MVVAAMSSSIWSLADLYKNIHFHLAHNLVQQFRGGGVELRKPRKATNGSAAQVGRAGRTRHRASRCRHHEGS